MPEKQIVLDNPVGIVRIISAHAIERWMQRTNASSESKSLQTLRRHLARAEEVQLAPQYRALALLNHKLEPARYLRFDAWIFVVSMDGALLTVHTGQAKRWLAEPQARQKQTKRRIR